MGNYIFLKSQINIVFQFFIVKLTFNRYSVLRLGFSLKFSTSVRGCRKPTFRTALGYNVVILSASCNSWQ
nr:MAG TPA: hypothetical protein [Caudoviricetes sp.]